MTVSMPQNKHPGLSYPVVEGSVKPCSLSHNDGTGEDVGLNGTSFKMTIFYHKITNDLPRNLSDYDMGRVHVVFLIPERTLPIVLIDGTEVPKHLAYVEWYTPLPDRPEPNHLLYKVSPQKDRDGTHICSIIPLANIRRSVHLYPRFGAFTPSDVPARAWPESPGFGLALGGLGLRKS